MVRFKASSSVSHSVGSFLSIPIWFDLKLNEFAKGVLDNVFNSYMVRFKVTTVTTGITSTHFSIPIWFDLKRDVPEDCIHFEIFFNSYMVRFKGLMPRR